MFILLLIIIFVLRFVRSTLIYSLLTAGLFLATAALLFQQNAEPNYLIGLGLSFVFSLFVTLFMARIPGRIDQLRLKKG